jgi:hypothetical protein
MPLGKSLFYRRHQPVMSRMGINQDHPIVGETRTLDVGILAASVVSFARSSIM